MNSGYYNQPPYPGVAFPALQPGAPAPEKPARPWPLPAVNRFLTIAAVAITLLAVVLAALAPKLVSGPPSTAGMTLAYQSSLTQNDSGQLHWDENGGCQFSTSGLLVTMLNANDPNYCQLQGSDFQDFTLEVHVGAISGVAAIGFHSGDLLEIFGSGRFFFLPQEPTPIQFSQAQQGIGSAALHNTELGVSERANDITIQVQGQTYSFYANGQLLATYTVTTQENSGPIFFGAFPGDQAEFSNIAIYTPRSA